MYALYILLLFINAYNILDAIIDCQSLPLKFLDTPCDAKTLEMCKFTEPLVRLAVDDINQIYEKANLLPEVVLEYFILFTDYAYMLVISIVLAGIPRSLWKSILWNISAMIGEEQWEGTDKPLL